VQEIFPFSKPSRSVLRPSQPLLSGKWARFPRGYGVRGVKLTTQLPQIPRSCKLYLNCPSRLRGLCTGYLIADPVYVRMYVRMYVYMYVCMYVYMYVCIYVTTGFVCYDKT